MWRFEARFIFRDGYTAMGNAEDLISAIRKLHLSGENYET